MTGTVLAGRYRIVSLLNRGGMGEVYRAEDLKLGASVSLKFLPASLRHDPKRLGFLLNEVRVARQISHPNVCRVYDVAESDGVHFISMEFVAGEDLRSLLRRIDRLPYDKALELAHQICEALAAAHDRGVLHRDLKPSNLMIDDKGRARIVDFGIAVAGGHVRGPEAGVGTPAYMSPEQLAGESATDKSDVYMLGLVLYELFTGRHPFRATEREELARLQAETDPEPPSALLPAIEPAVEKVVLACLERDPQRRPASASMVAEALAARSTWAESTTVQALLALRPVEHGVPRECWARLVEELAEDHGGHPLDSTEDELWLFRRPIDAVRFALHVHQGILREGADGQPGLGIGIHLAEVDRRPEWLADDGSAGTIDTHTRAVLRRLVGLARGRQTLMTQAAFDLARRSASAGIAGSGKLRWLVHGGYHVDGAEEALEICEVGIEDDAPLEAPATTDGVERLHGRDTILGWRPAPGLRVAHRPRWELDRKLGEGGFGEVWLARHDKTAELRAFKFCYDASRLRALQREITLFRLLKEELGERRDIARIYDWNFEQAPYFIESEYSADGNLEEWVARLGGLGQLDLAERLEIVAQVATALAAAHSVGVLHKDVKPTNVLMNRDPGGNVRARLTDFGVGAVTEERLAAVNFTVQGWTEEPRGRASTPTGTRLFMAPEILEGRRPTLQADIYALGVMLYQVSVGDFSRVLAPGWERDVDDELLREDIAAAVDGQPERRLASASQMAQRLRHLENRRAELWQARREREEARLNKVALERSRRRRRVFLTAFLILAVFAGAMGFMWRKVTLEAETARRVSDFLVELFEVSDPEKLDEDLTAREVLERGARRIESELADQPSVQSRLLLIVGKIQYNLGLYDRAGPLIERSLAIRRSLYGNDHAEIAASLSALADVRRLQVELEEAEGIAREALLMRRRLFGKEHVEVAQSLESLGRIALVQGDFDAAAAGFQEAFDMRQRLQGADHPDASATLVELGELALLRTEYARARDLLEAALEVHRRRWGQDHPRVARVLNQLGEAFHGLGELEASEALHKEALDQNRRLLGETHPTVAGNLVSMALLYRDLGDLDRSREYFESALDVYRESLGSDHPYTIATVGRFANLLQSQGDDQAAEALYRETLEQIRENVGGENLVAANQMIGLAAILRRRRAFEEADQLLQKTLTIRRDQLGEHYLTASTLNSLGLLRVEQGDYESAETCFLDAVALYRKVSTQEANVASTLIHLAKVRLAMDRPSDAERDAREAFALFSETVPAGHWLFSYAEAVLAASLGRQGHEEAEAMLAKAHQELIQSRGSEAPPTRYAAEQLKLLRKSG